MMMTKNDRRGRVRRRAVPATLALAGALLLGACDFDITDTNAPTLESLTGSPTRAIMARAATGIFAQAYDDVATEIEFYALYGREGYDLLGNDPRETGEQIRGPQDPTGRNSGIWVGPYSAIRTINTYLDALERTSGLNEAEVRASQGFAKTLKAWHIHRLAVRTGAHGIPIEVDRSIDAEPAPFVTFAEAMAEASRLLDEAMADLEAAGSTPFPFTVAPGFEGFGDPTSFIEFNRALAAKVLVHRATFVDCQACWQEASDAMDASFVTDANLPESLDVGVYYAYSAASGEPTNPVTASLSNDEYWVHPTILNGAQQRSDGSDDLRLTEKVMDAGRSLTLDDLTGTHKPVMFNSAADPTQPDLGADIPWIHNEELLLLRAEIRWNTGNEAGAIADINRVRQHAGGLPPTTLTVASSDEAFVDELLYNRLYSLMWEQGTRWIDARRYDRLDELPIDREGDVIFPNMAVPANECAARDLGVPCQPLG